MTSLEANMPVTTSKVYTRVSAKEYRRLVRVEAERLKAYTLSVSSDGSMYLLPKVAGVDNNIGKAVRLKLAETNIAKEYEIAPAANKGSGRDKRRKRKSKSHGGRIK